MPKNLDEVELKGDEEYNDIIVNHHKPSSRSEIDVDTINTFLNKLVDLMIQNQKIVENVVRSNDALREDIAVMIGKMERLYDKFDEFVGIIKETAEEDTEEHIAKEIVEKSVEPLQQAMSQLVKSIQESNETISELLMSIDKRLKRLSVGSSNASADGSLDIKQKMAELLAQKQQGGM